MNVRIAYQLIAGICTAAFIAIVYYLVVLWQYPQVPVSSGYILGTILGLYGVYRLIKAETKSKRGDARTILIGALMLILLTFTLCIANIKL